MSNATDSAPKGAFQLNPIRMEAELRIRDLDLAARLGFGNPIDIRKLVRRYGDDLGRMGVLATVAKTSSEQGGRPATEFYLNRKQAIFITTKSETPEATDITIEIIERFEAYEQGAAKSGADLATLSFSRRLAIVREVRLTMGRAAAREYWFKLNLPVVPAMMMRAAQEDLFAAPAHGGQH